MYLTNTFKNAYRDSPLPPFLHQRQENEHVDDLIALSLELFEQANTRVSTSELNRALEEALSLHRPTRKKSKSPKIYYATQVGVVPPTFVLFVNEPELFDSDYERYLSNQLRKRLPYSEAPQILFPSPDKRAVHRTER